jgi:ribosomal protein S18 acetylase RimI-like enzyme
MKDVRKIKIEDTYALRHQILRPHQTIDQCRYPGDFDELTAHLGIFEADELVGILSIYKVQNNEIEIPDSWQLRAMATSTGARGKGYGFKLLNAAEVYASQHQALCIWANARVSALGFYQKAGYRIMGEEFGIEGVGPHYLVAKTIA